MTLVPEKAAVIMAIARAGVGRGRAAGICDQVGWRPGAMGKLAEKQWDLAVPRSGWRDYRASFVRHFQPMHPVAK